MSAFTRQDWITRFVGELVVVVGALGEGSATSGALSAAPADGWIVTLEAGHGATGLLHVQVGRAGIEAFTRKITGLEVDAPEDAVIDTLKEICAQAAGGVVQQAPCSGTTLSVINAGPAAAATPDAPVLMSIAGEGLEPLLLALWGTIELVPAGAPPPSEAPTHGPKLDVILDIDLPLMVRFGRTELPLKILTSLAPGSVIDLGRSPDDPVEVLVSNQIVARGEVVIVGGNYGVRITDVISPAERVRSMEVDFR